MPPHEVLDRQLQKKGLCIVCGKPVPPVCIQHQDPYCSTQCARIAHGAVGK